MLEPAYFILTYEVVPNYVEARVPYRQEHLRLAQAFTEKGHLLLGGALEDPADAAVLVFHAPDVQTVEEFARRDPYVRAGIVKSWRIRKWKVVAGSACANPIRL